MFASMLVSAAAFLAACETKPEVKPTTPVTPASPLTNSPSPTTSGESKTPAAKADALVGEWTGAEGAALKVEKKGEKYEIEIRSKAGSQKYEGAAKGDVIEFTRNGKTETIKAATLEETGMKWTGGEKTCAVITKGSEAYCRK